MPTPRLAIALTFPATFSAAIFQANVDAQVAARAATVTANRRVLDETGRDMLIAELQFVFEIERDTLAEWLRARLGQTGGPTGTVSTHRCAHGEADQWNCRDDPRAQFVETTG